MIRCTCFLCFILHIGSPLRQWMVRSRQPTQNIAFLGLQSLRTLFLLKGVDRQIDANN